MSCALKKLPNEMFFALIRLVLFEKRLPPFWRKKLLLRPLVSRNLLQNKSFSIDFGYDCRSVLNHVLKSYDDFFYVRNSRKRVVCLIYTKQFLLWACCRLFACDKVVWCKGLDKRQIFGDQTPSNVVWWTNILPFGHLVWCCLIVFDHT